MSTLFGVDQHIAYVDTLNACPKLPDDCMKFVYKRLKKHKYEPLILDLKDERKEDKELGQTG